MPGSYSVTTGFISLRQLLWAWGLSGLNSHCFREIPLVSGMFCFPVHYINTNILKNKSKKCWQEIKKFATALEWSLTTKMVLSFWLKGSMSSEKYRNHLSRSVLVGAASAGNLDTRWCNEEALLLAMERWVLGSSRISSLLGVCSHPFVGPPEVELIL